MVDSRRFFPKKYLHGDDLVGREVTLTVRAATVESLHTEGGKKDCIVIYFKETQERAIRDAEPDSEKRIVLGKTLQQDFESHTGSPLTEKWIGHRFVFYRGKAIAGGKMCIRARPAPVTEKTEPQPQAEEITQ